MSPYAHLHRCGCTADILKVAQGASNEINYIPRITVNVTFYLICDLFIERGKSLTNNGILACCAYLKSKTVKARSKKPVLFGNLGTDKITRGHFLYLWLEPS